MYKNKESKKKNMNCGIKILKNLFLFKKVHIHVYAIHNTVFNNQK